MLSPIRPDASGFQCFIDKVNDLAGTPTEPAEFRHDQGISILESFQQLINPSFPSAFARRNRNRDEIINLEPVLLGVFQNFELLIVEILFIR
jgi:hypothetical protein